jgi:hypothetical protein
MKNAATADQAPGCKHLYILGLLSVLLFWLPLLAPFIQFAAVVESFRVARWGVASRLSLAVGLGGAVLGFILFLVLEYVWVI